MSLESFWPQSFNEMKKSRVNKDKKDTLSEVAEGAQDGGQADSDIPDGLDPALAKALSLMTANIIKVIDEKLSPLAETIHKHAAELQTASKRLDEAEARLLATEEAAATHEPRIIELEKQVSALKNSLDMAENYNRRLNIRVVGLAEDTEKGQPVDFFETWLSNVLKLTTKAGRVKLERAHRSLAPKPDPDKRPRSLLLRFHSFRDKQRVMEAARRASNDGGLIHNGSRLSFFSDYSSAVVKRRKEYDAVKQLLRERGIPYAMLFPAILQVTHGGSRRKFTTPGEAHDYIDTMSG
ncbi:unnamed protein product [Knipowitschia caucasica]